MRKQSQVVRVVQQGSCCLCKACVGQKGSYQTSREVNNNFGFLGSMGPGGLCGTNTGSDCQRKPSPMLPCFSLTRPPPSLFFSPCAGPAVHIRPGPGSHACQWPSSLPLRLSSPLLLDYLSARITPRAVLLGRMWFLYTCDGRAELAISAVLLLPLL